MTQPERSWCIEPAAGENYEGRQWGWNVSTPDGPSFHLVAGGTAQCWNIGENVLNPEDDDRETIHVCDLEEFIEALEAFRDSDVRHKEEARWD